MPIYKVAESIDGVNFSPETMWEGTIAEGQFFDYGSGQRGRQYIGEATDLAAVADDSYDFVLSCHSLEHVANPLKALHEWKRVVRSGGHILLVLPNKEANFDHRRPITSLDHLLRDLAADIGEDDLTHLEEILSLHDLARDKAAGTAEQFATRSRQNLRNRGLHHHVFDLNLVKEVVRAIGLEPTFFHGSYYDHVVLARVEK
jgi:SAM-dependent methyltransferase